MLLEIFLMITCALTAPVQEDNAPKFHELNGDIHRHIMSFLPPAERSKMLTIPRVNRHVQDSAPRLFYEKFGIHAVDRLLNYEEVGDGQAEFRRQVISHMPRSQLSHLINLAVSTDSWVDVDFMLNHGVDPQSLLYSVHRAVLYGNHEEIEILYELLDGRLDSYEIFEYNWNITQLQHLFSDAALPLPSEDYVEGEIYPSALIEKHPDLNFYLLATPHYMVLDDETTVDELGEYLIYAAIYNQTHTFRKLLSIGINIDWGFLPEHYPEDERITPLIIAVYGGYMEILQLAIEAGADLNVPDLHGRTALMNAVLEGRLEMARMLIEAGADLDVQDDDGNTALMLAVIKYSVEMIKLLIDAGADLDIRDSLGRTAFMFSLHRGPTRLSLFLVNKGANVNVRDENGKTALIMASQSLHTETVKFLLRIGADTDVQDSRKATALIYAVDLGLTDIFNLLVDDGADLNKQDRNGRTALMYAASKDRKEMANALIARGADLNVRDNLNDTVMNYYAAKNDIQMVEKLAKSGGVGNFEGRNSVLMAAIIRGSVKTVKLVLKSGHSVNFRNSRGTPLILAIRRNNVGKVTALIEAGADVNMLGRIDGRETTPMIEAVNVGNVEIVKKLLEHRAKASLKDSDGKTAWDHAFRLKNDEINKLVWDTKLPLIAGGFGDVLRPLVQSWWKW